MNLRVLVPVISGVLFALGLVFGGMTDPAKVIGFLDVTGEWDASLLVVMAGAVALNLITFRHILKLRHPVFGVKWSLPGSREIDARLLLGSALFGVGWGLAGYCPGPALASLATGGVQLLAFGAALVVGMLFHDRVLRA